MNSNNVENYGWTTPDGPHSCGYITPEILLILRELGVKRVLDLGAGNGNLCLEMSKAGLDVVGVEFDKKGASIAKENYANIPFYYYGVQDSPTELLSYEQKFDSVVSTDVIEQLFSPHLLPVYAASVLKDSGYLVITTPYHGDLKNFVLSLAVKWDDHFTPLWHGGHIKFWSRRTLSELLSKNGFKVINFSGIRRLPFLWKSMVLIAKKV